MTEESKDAKSSSDESKSSTKTDVLKNKLLSMANENSSKSDAKSLDDKKSEDDARKSEALKNKLVKLANTDQGEGNDGEDALADDVSKKLSKDDSKKEEKVKPKSDSKSKRGKKKKDP